jgi:glycosyltransferase involved in cell wall biosynthesis
MAPRRTLLLNGPTTGLSSFAIVNRHLAAGLTVAGYDVWRGDVPSLADVPGLPDVSLTNGHPYDVLNAPGRVNVFQLSYDYARFTRADRSLKDAIDARFDLCVVPSRFVRDVCRASGVERPVVVCPHGVDLDEFHPGAAPAALPTRKRFRFVYVGGATERKGVDVLVEAFTAEFRADDDVALVLKTFSYEHLLPWFAAVRERVGDRGPEIVHVHGDEPSIAGYFTAADVGVFPFRGEAFALPVLECLATGTPVIVTRGGGPADYCTPENAELILARPRTSDGKRHLEPDVAHLRQLMRGAYERRDRARDRDRIRRSVAGFTWERAVATLVEAIETCRDRKRSRPRSVLTPVVHAYGHVGRTSWKKVAAHVDAALHARFETRSVDLQSAVPDGNPRVLVAQSGFALEHFVAATQRNGSRRPRILVRGSAPFDAVLQIVNRERTAWGLDPRRPSPMEVWRHRQEERLADLILVHSRFSARQFVTHGWRAEALAVVHLGFTASRPRPRGRRDRLRFLFLGTDPFRKGIGVLLQAWDALRPRGAELRCLVDTEVLRSERVLRVLVRNPNVDVRPLVAHAQLAREYDEADCQILPSLEEGFAVAVADGMGRGLPAIVSAATGVAEVLTDRRDGFVVETGSCEALRDAIAEACDDRVALERMGHAAFETARRRPWSRFEHEVGDVVARLLAGEAS